ncbi:MAG: aspartate/glutamate racemase family protein [Candidatus Hodarchaeota archaeon]
MKTIGLIGGMSWESSIEYYRIINETVKENLGGLHSAKSIMYSFDFYEIEILQEQGKWEEIGNLMVEAAQNLELYGAELIILCTNTIHLVSDSIQSNISIPLIHIVDATAEKIKETRIQKIGLIGTKFTMESDFFKRKLEYRYNLSVLVPEMQERQVIHDIIFKELVLGEIKEKSKLKYLKIIKQLEKKGAEGVILGCTEIPLLITQQDADIPLFDTTTIHAKAAVMYALADN